ncbi:MAG: hypothetical protein U5R06_07160 [candidate division KSB1 bacterium]|nr:hypothetical protein [candidate division KSB1 bacterium]
MKKLFKYTGLTLAALVVAAAFLLSVILYWPFYTLSNSENVDIIVPWGASFDRVTETLKSRNVIANKHLFKLSAKLLADTQNLRAGKFTLHEAHVK